MHFATGRAAFDLANFQRCSPIRSFVEPLLTTFTIATSVSAVCCLVAAPMAWLVGRTDMPARNAVRLIVTASFVTPPFLGAIAWELLAAPNSGLLNQLWRAVTGAPPDDALFDIYTLTGPDLRHLLLHVSLRLRAGGECTGACAGRPRGCSVDARLVALAHGAQDHDCRWRCRPCWRDCWSPSCRR